MMGLSWAALFPGTITAAGRCVTAEVATAPIGPWQAAEKVGPTTTRGGRAARRNPTCCSAREFFSTLTDI